MATLEKIRSKAAMLVIVVGLAMFAFIIGDFLNSGSTFFRMNQQRIAKVDGKVINIDEYQERVDQMTEMYKNQMGSTSLSDEYMAQIRQSVFDAMVQEIVLGEATQKLGMEVSPEELFDMVQGQNISPLITQMSMFMNQQGQFDKTALLNFLKTIDTENIASYPADQQEQIKKAKSFWMFWEKNIKLQRLEQKYTILLGKAVSANKLDAKAAYDDESVNSDLTYAVEPYSAIPDASVKVTASEIEKKYNEQKEMYKTKETKVLNYIVADITPSKDDYDKAQQTITNLKDELSKTDKVGELVTENSEIPYVDAFFSTTALDEDMKTFVATANKGDIYGPVFNANKYRMFKLVDKTLAPDSVKISHIMISGKTEDVARAEADSLLKLLQGGANFEELAKANSADQSASNGGELGWFTDATALRGVNEEFRDAAFSTPVGGYKIVKSSYGIHIIKVDERTANVNKYKIADVDMTVSPSSASYSKIYNDLNQFVSKNETMANMEKKAKTAGYQYVSNASVTPDDQTLGSIKNSRAVIRWAFQNAKGKDVSEILECDEKFVVASVQKSYPEGYAPVSAVAPQIKARLIAEKKGEKIIADLKAKNLTSLDAYAQAMHATVDSVKFVNFATPRIAGIGVEPKLNAAITLASLNSLSAPVAGNNGVFVFQVYNRTKDATPYDEKARVDAINTSNAYRVSYQAIQELINKAKIKDNRIRFY